MLRNLLINLRTMNEDVFIGTMQDFYSEYRGRRASTRDFQRMVEQHVGSDMNWFFDERVHEHRHPQVCLLLARRTRSGRALHAAAACTPRGRARALRHARAGKNRVCLRNDVRIRADQGDRTFDRGGPGPSRRAHAGRVQPVGIRSGGRERRGVELGAAIGEDSRSQCEPHQLRLVQEPQPVLQACAVLVHRSGADRQLQADLLRAVTQRE